MQVSKSFSRGARPLRAAFLLVALAPAPIWADTVQNGVIKQLQGQGYQSITVSRTWLGRVRILAYQGDDSREIVLNPRTGEVLRDVQLRASGQGGGSGASASGPATPSPPVLQDHAGGQDAPQNPPSPTSPPPQGGPDGGPPPDRGGPHEGGPEGGGPEGDGPGRGGGHDG